MKRVLAILPLLVLSFSCDSGQKGGPRTRPAPQVAVQDLKREDIEVRRSYLVTLLPGEQAGVLSRTSGYVQQILVDRGDQISKGDRLALVDNQEIDAQQRQAAAQVELAEASLNNAKDQAKRLGDLVSKELVAPAHVDNAETAVKVGEAQLKAAQAALSASKTRSSWSEIVAPFDGYIITRGVDVGALVGPQGPVLFQVGTNKTVKAVATIPQADIAKIAVGLAGELKIEGTQESFEGVVSRFAPALDEKTRTLAVELSFDNPEGRLKPGMYGRVSLVIDELKDALVVPPRAVVRRGEVGSIFVVKDGKAVEVMVGLGRTLPDARVEVISGLNDGDTMITLGRDLVRDGQDVRTVSETDLRR